MVPVSGRCLQHRAHGPDESVFAECEEGNGTSDHTWPERSRRHSGRSSVQAGAADSFKSGEIRHEVPVHKASAQARCRSRTPEPDRRRKEMFAKLAGQSDVIPDRNPMVFWSRRPPAMTS
jgi:hypothetical protein